MRNFTLTTLLFYFFLNVHAQQFSELYDYGDFANDGSTIVKTNNGYLSNHSSNDLVNWRLSTLITHHNLSGNLLWGLSLSDENHIFTQSDKNFCIAFDSINNNYFIAGNFAESDTSADCPFLLKITSEGQILDTIYYSNLSIEHVFGFRVTIVGNTIYYLCQNHNLSQSYLLQCNLNGSYLNHTVSAIGVQSDPKFITDVGDGLVIGGRYLPSGASNNSIQYVRKFDYEGNELWTNEYTNGNDQLGAVNAVPLPNGNVLFAATRNNNLGDYSDLQPFIGEIDNTSGDTLWTRAYLHPDSIRQVHNFKRLSTGEYILIGESREQMPQFTWDNYITASFIMKLDSEFNLLWKRIYVPENYAAGVGPLPTCKLNDFVENEDGGITALGMAFTYTGTGLQSGYIQDSWLMRVDREGCLVSGCAVDITEHQNDKHLFVYPNPASDVLNIQFPHLDKWQVSIYNMQGALVKEEQPNQLLQYSMDVKEWPSGVYTVLCKDTNGKMFAEKVVKP